jgi:hypothetical protein
MTRRHMTPRMTMRKRLYRPNLPGRGEAQRQKFKRTKIAQKASEDKTSHENRRTKRQVRTAEQEENTAEKDRKVSPEPLPFLAEICISAARQFKHKIFLMSQIVCKMSYP